MGSICTKKVKPKKKKRSKQGGEDNYKKVAKISDSSSNLSLQNQSRDEEDSSFNRGQSGSQMAWNRLQKAENGVNSENMIMIHKDDYIRMLEEERKRLLTSEQRNRPDESRTHEKSILAKKGKNGPNSHSRRSRNVLDGVELENGSAAAMEQDSTRTSPQKGTADMAVQTEEKLILAYYIEKKKHFEHLHQVYMGEQGHQEAQNGKLPLLKNNKKPAKKLGQRGSLVSNANSRKLLHSGSVAVNTLTNKIDTKLKKPIFKSHRFIEDNEQTEDRFNPRGLSKDLNTRWRGAKTTQNTPNQKNLPRTPNQYSRASLAIPSVRTRSKDNQAKKKKPAAHFRRYSAMKPLQFRFAKRERENQMGNYSSSENDGVDLQNLIKDYEASFMNNSEKDKNEKKEVEKEAGGVNKNGVLGAGLGGGLLSVAKSSQIKRKSFQYAEILKEDRGNKSIGGAHSVQRQADKVSVGPKGDGVLGLGLKKGKTGFEKKGAVRPKSGARSIDRQEAGTPHSLNRQIRMKSSELKSSTVIKEEENSPEEKSSRDNKRAKTSKKESFKASLKALNLQNQQTPDADTNKKITKKSRNPVTPKTLNIPQTQHQIQKLGSRGSITHSQRSVSINVDMMNEKIAQTFKELDKIRDHSEASSSVHNKTPYSKRLSKMTRDSQAQAPGFSVSGIVIRNQQPEFKRSQTKDPTQAVRGLKYVKRSSEIIGLTNSGKPMLVKQTSILEAVDELEGGLGGLRMGGGRLRNGLGGQRFHSISPGNVESPGPSIDENLKEKESVMEYKLLNQGTESRPSIVLSQIRGSHDPPTTSKSKMNLTRKTSGNNGNNNTSKISRERESRGGYNESSFTGGGGLGSRDEVLGSSRRASPGSKLMQIEENLQSDPSMWPPTDNLDLSTKKGGGVIKSSGGIARKARKRGEEISNLSSSHKGSEELDMDKRRFQMVMGGGEEGPPSLGSMMHGVKSLGRAESLTLTNKLRRELYANNKVSNSLGVGKKVKELMGPQRDTIEEDEHSSEEESSANFN